MRWTVPLTALAIETRYKNPRVLKKFAVSTADTKMMRAKWEATIHTFLEQALIDNAWGDAEQPRDVSVDQFKNKLNAVRTAYRAKRTQLLATGNKALEDTSGSEDEEEEGQYAEMPRNFFFSRQKISTATSHVIQWMLTQSTVSLLAKSSRPCGHCFATSFQVIPAAQVNQSLSLGFRATDLLKT
ncbi:hypothetical protein PInf_004328 [Phytophthora infestans]|nr:hypothetical protein PInf_004328 [Phytophthora infestans]